MKILHLAAHLGGGIGKAHAALSPHFPSDVEQVFALLETPIDRRPLGPILARDDDVIVANLAGARRLAEMADIVQIEYWGHPSLDDLLFGWRPRPPTVCWCHVSGLHPPYLPPRLLDMVDRFVMTSPITRSALPSTVTRDAQVINSGFGFPEPIEPRPRRDKGKIVYLGTVGFKKLHPEIFAAIDDVPSWGLHAPIDFWGHISPEVAAARGHMAHPHRVNLRGHTLDPRAALMAGDVFLYPLRPEHYGTGENALIEAMSLGLVPVVLNNAAEAAIVTHGKTGIVADTLDHAVRAARGLARSPEYRAELGANARLHAASTTSAAKSAGQFVELWRGLMVETKEHRARA